MPIISIRIPQLGEGLQEALLVEFLKQAGDEVRRDDAIYVMETDKAATEVESPHDGRIVEWLVEPGSVLPIGTEIARMEVAHGVREINISHGSLQGSTAPALEIVSKPLAQLATPQFEQQAGLRACAAIPPRTMKHLRQAGLVELADQIPVRGSKMMPADVDDYLKTLRRDVPESETCKVVELPKSQIILNYRFTRGAQVCVPGSVMNEITWSRVETARETTRHRDGPSAFAISCWCIVQALKKHDKFRSTISGDGKTLKVFTQINLGVAVALPEDRLLTAVVRNAGSMDQNTFFAAYTSAVSAAQSGEDQADESTTITVSNIGSVGMRSGIPVIVAPAMATLALGEAFFQPVPVESGFSFKHVVMATLSFDHRITNGVGAANFLNDVKCAVENFSLEAALLSSPAEA